MRHLFYFLTLAVFTSFTDPTIPQKPLPNYPKGYFQSPVAHTIELAGTFGELRANHFHSGIDISPGFKLSNEPIYAAAEGYVSRIQVQAGGYGQALYITHPNGYTTVYGHLEKLSFSIDTFLKRKQYASESFEQNLILQPQDLPVLRGQEIALMGNRGHSSGQHLHFEIRETKTDNPINPLLFGISVSDNIAPTINALKVYLLNDKKEIVDTKILDVVRRGRDYVILGDTVFVASNQVGFALKTYDKQDGKSGNNGVYSLEMKQNDSLLFEFTTEKFGFNETRYLNAHLDYTAQMSRQGFFNRTFLLPGNQLSMYDKVVNNGIISMNNDVKKITLKSTDAAGNATNLQFYLKNKNFIINSKPKTYNYFLPFDEPSLINTEGAKFFFSKGSFYENVYLNFAQTTEGGTYGTYSPTYHVHDALTPLHWLMAVSIKPVGLPDSLRKKAFIAFCPRGETSIYNCGGGWSDEGYLVGKNNKFGRYCIMVDQTPPKITPLRFQYDMKKFSKMSFRIRDNIETVGGGEGLKYRAEVDGAWFLMEFDGKSDVLYHQFDDFVDKSQPEIIGAEHTFRLEVTDNRGNSSVLEGKFKR